MNRCKLLATTLLLALAACGCATKPDGPKKFHTGDICVIRTTGERVTIVRVWRYIYRPNDPCWKYRCRVAGAGQRRRDGLVSADTEFIAYPLVDFYGFELREEVPK